MDTAIHDNQTPRIRRRADVPSRIGHAVAAAPAQPLSRLKRGCFIAMAGGFFALGVLGIILPGLPTTPFLLLTSYFLLRAWPSMNERLLASRLFGGILRDWQHHGGVRRHVKLKAVALVAVMICATLLLVELSPIARGLLAGGSLLGMLVISRLREVTAA